MSVLVDISRADLPAAACSVGLLPAESSSSAAAPQAAAAVLAEGGAGGLVSFCVVVTGVDAA